MLCLATTEDTLPLKKQEMSRRPHLSDPEAVYILPMTILLHQRQQINRSIASNLANSGLTSSWLMKGQLIQCHF